jgi:ferric-dicitrate binding protein FerR (iron transport regulator)
MNCTNRIDDGAGGAGMAEDVVALALGALSADDAAKIEAHLADCAACRKEFDDANRLFAAARNVPEPTLRADGEARLLAAVRAERDAAPPPETADIPRPTSTKRRVSKILAMSLPLAAAAAVFVAMVASSRSHRVELLRGAGELLPCGESASAVVGLDPSGTPSFAFGEGDEIFAGNGELLIRVPTKAGDAAPAPDGPAPGALEIRLLPGARLRRIGADEVELVAGVVDVAAGPLGRPFAVDGGRGAGRAVVKGTRFVASTADERMVVVVREGVVELGRAGGPSESLAAGEQGLVDRERLLHRPADAGGRGDAFLAPRVALARGTAPLEFGATLTAGDGGPVSIVAFDDAYPTFVLRVHADGEPSREIKLQRSMLVEAAPAPGGDGAWRLSAETPYRLTISLAGIGLAPGRYHAGIRYMSYRRHGDGAEWLGVAESAPVDFEVPAK